MQIISKQFFDYLCNSNLQVAFYGGSFNPFHYGHYNIILNSYKALNLDCIVLLVAYSSATKQYSKTAKQRAHDAMEQINQMQFSLIKPKIYISDIEEELKYSYSYLIAKYIASKAPSNKFINKRYFIMGADSLINFHKWEYCDIISFYMNLVVFDRPNYTNNAIKSKSINKIYSFYKIKYNYVSSSNIRNI